MGISGSRPVNNKHKRKHKHKHKRSKSMMMMKQGEDRILPSADLLVELLSLDELDTPWGHGRIGPTGKHKDVV